MCCSVDDDEFNFYRATHAKRNFLSALPTVAPPAGFNLDDMCLVTLSKGALDQMMSICVRYSCKWRYEYNARKCAVIVFNDTYRHVNVDKRQWMLGREPVDEKYDYTHLGVKLSKVLSVGVCVSEAADKLRAYFFRLVSCGLHDQGVNPLTSFKIYKSVVLPKALYGCELWDNISNDDLLKLERSHRKCLIFIQGLPRSTRSDVVPSMIGSRSLEGEIDRRKLIFFEQMGNLPDTFVAKSIFLNRVVSYYDRPYQKKSFVPDIHRIFAKYGLIHVFNHFIASGQFPSKIAWKYLIKCSIDEYETASRIARMRSDTYLLSYANMCPIVLSPMPLWLLCKQFPCLFNNCMYAAKVIGLLFSAEYFQVCRTRGFLFTNAALHAVFECQTNENLKLKLLDEIFKNFGSHVYRQFIMLDPRKQILHLCFGLCQFIVEDENREKCLKIVVKLFHHMLLYVR